MHETKTQLIKMALKSHARGHDGDWSFMEKPFWQWFYTIKCVICILLDRQGDDLDEVGPIAAWDFIRTNHYEFCAGADWKELRVAYGVLTNWQYRVFHNGYP
jgi:hypothetical protein